MLRKKSWLFFLSILFSQISFSAPFKISPDKTTTEKLVICDEENGNELELPVAEIDKKEGSQFEKTYVVIRKSDVPKFHLLTETTNYRYRIFIDSKSGFTTNAKTGTSDVSLKQVAGNYTVSCTSDGSKKRTVFDYVDSLDHLSGSTLLPETSE